MKKFNLAFYAIAFLAVIGISSCKNNCCEQVENVTDYSIAENWMIAQTEANHEVDMVFYYPSAILKGTDTTQALNEAEKKVAYFSYQVGPECFSSYANVFAPYYRQIPLDIAFSVSQSEGYLDLMRKQEVIKDVFASLDYYFNNYNNGRPFILAGHSQGSAVLRIILDDYMQQHPDYYQRMIAAYAIGFALPESWFAQNPHLKKATGETDTGVVIGWNTEGPAATMENFVTTKDSWLINPLTWSTGAEYVPASENKGSLQQSLTDLSIGDIELGYADAQIDTVRRTLICTTCTEYAAAGPLGDKTLHGKDWSLYYNNIKENGKKRAEAFVGHEIN